jgi:hypothetical protein
MQLTGQLDISQTTYIPSVFNQQTFSNAFMGQTTVPSGRDIKYAEKFKTATHILDNMTLIEHPWHPQEQELSHMTHQTEEERGHHMGKMAGTLDQH